MLRRSAPAAVPLAASGVLLLAAHLAGLLAFLLPVVPLLLLVASLLCGVYPGCETLIRLAGRRGRPRRRAAANQVRPARRWAFSISGGLLIAFARAERPPPLAS